MDMELKILFIKNRISYSIEDDINKYAEWLRAMFGFEADIMVQNTDWKLGFEPFKNALGQIVGWGTKGTKQKIREEALVKPFEYHLVFFLYDVYKSGWIDTPIDNLMNWTFPQDLNGAGYCEITSKDWYDKQDALFGLFRHEGLHAFSRILNWKRIDIAENLDGGEPESSVVEKIAPYNEKIVEPFSNIFQRMVIIDTIIMFSRILLARLINPRQEIISMIEKVAQRYGLDKDRVIRVAERESGLNPKARNKNKNLINGIWIETTDRGLFQINDYFHNEINNDQADNPEFATNFFCSYVKKGRAYEWFGAENIFWKRGKNGNIILI